MTVKVEIVNSGNHPADVVVVYDQLKRRKVALARGDAYAIEAGRQYRYEVERHGSGADCRQHEATVVQTEITDGDTQDAVGWARAAANAVNEALKELDPPRRLAWKVEAWDPESQSY